MEYFLSHFIYNFFLAKNLLTYFEQKIPQETTERLPKYDYDYAYEDMADALTTPNTLATFEEILTESSEEYDSNREEDETDES